MNGYRVVKYLLVGIALVVGLGLFGALAIHLYGAHRLADVSRRYEREVGPLSVRAFVRPKVAVEENAVTWQRPGVLAAVFFPGDQALVGSLSARPFSDWSRDDASSLEAVLARNGPAIELLEHARGMRASNWEIAYDQGTTAKIPNLLAAVNAAKMLAARGRLAHGRGDRETAIVTAETLGALARSHEAEPSTIVLLIGLAIERLQLGLVHELTASAITSRDDLDRLDASLCDEDLSGAVRHTIRGDAAAIVHDVGSESESMLTSLHTALHRRIRRVLANVVAAVALEAHRAAEKNVGGPVIAPLPDTSTDEEGGGWWNRLANVYAPNVASVSARATATASARDLARLAIALRRAASVDGRYPATLPTIAGVPTDDPLTGGPRGYVVRADGSAELRSMTTVEIIRSISPGLQLPLDALYRFTLPAPRRGSVT
jgi:hypothetical protein